MELKPILFALFVSLPTMLVLSAETTARFANDLLECVKDTPINTCLRQTLDNLRPLMSQGIPELGIRRTEPLNIHNLRFVTKPGIGVQIESEFENVLVRGLSSFETRMIDADLDSRRLNIALFVPKVDIVGNYKARGKVLVLDNIEGNGSFNSTLIDVSGSGSAEIVPVGPKDNQTLSVRNTNIDFNIGRAIVHLNNLFNGEFPALATHVNNFINDNSNIIINEVKPQIRDEIRGLVEKVLNNAFSKIPVGQFLEKIPRNFDLPRAGRNRRVFF